MTVSSIEVTAGSGTHIWTDSRSVSSVTRHAQFVLPAPRTYATYAAVASGISVATSASHLIQLMGDGTNYTRITRIKLRATDDIPAAATQLLIGLYRLSTAGTGGVAAACNPYDAGDSAYATTPLTLNSSKGTEGALLGLLSMPLPSSHPLDAKALWEAQERNKEIIIGTSTANGIAVKILTGVASCTVDVVVEFHITSFL